MMRAKPHAGASGNDAHELPDLETIRRRNPGWGDNVLADALHALAEGFSGSQKLHVIGLASRLRPSTDREAA